MFVWNVTFIHRDWHITTTVESLYEDDEVVTGLAYLALNRSLGVDFSKFRFVDIEVDYVETV